MTEKNIHQEHDKGYKYLLQSKRAFMDLLRSFVKSDWVELIREEDLVRVDKSFILQDFSGKEADIVYRSQIKGQDVIFYVLLELQSTIDYQMPWRLFQYMSEIWRDHLQNTPAEAAAGKNFRLPAIVPLVLYNGSGPWTATRSFREYQKGHELFTDELIDFKYGLVSVKGHTEADLVELATLMSAVFFLDQDIDKNELKRRLGVLMTSFGNLIVEDQRQLLAWAGKIVKGRVGESVDVEAELNFPKGVENMQHALERIIDEERLEGWEKGKIEGWEQGKLEGKLEGKQETARAALRKGLDCRTVAEITGLSLAAIEELQQEVVN